MKFNMEILKVDGQANISLRSTNIFADSYGFFFLSTFSIVSFITVTWKLLNRETGEW